MNSLNEKEVRGQLARDQRAFVRASILSIAPQPINFNTRSR